MRYVFSNLGQGLRRNLSMHVAVILTIFVSLTLVGIGFLLHQQANKAADQWGNELQITVYLCRDGDPNPACLNEVTPAQKTAIEKVVEESPEVADWHEESKQEAYEKAKLLLGPDYFKGPHPAATADDFPQSVWITLKDPKHYDGITSAVVGLDGVSTVRDQHEVIGPILRSIEAMQKGAVGFAIVLVVAALLLVANTIRLAAFARRREIGIMRLVGASTMYIALPFLLEAVVTALIGVGLAVGALGAFMYFGVDGWLKDFIGFIPWVDMSDFWLSVIVVVILGPILTLAPTLLLTRKYIKV